MGIDIEGGSTIAVTDIKINGGAVGIKNTNQQVNFKNIYFKSCTKAYVAAGGFNSLLQGVTFDSCGRGIESTSGHGDVILLDSESKNSGPAVVFADSSNDGGKRNNQVVIQNLKHDTTNPIAVLADGTTVALEAKDTVDTWIWGNAVPGQYVKGQNANNTRSQALLDDAGKFFMMDAPTYAGFDKDQVVNVKDVSGQAVAGDGSTDDTASLNAILKQNADNCKIT